MRFLLVFELILLVRGAVRGRVSLAAAATTALKAIAMRKAHGVNATLVHDAAAVRSLIDLD
jgi:hypothetical protein